VAKGITRELLITTALELVDREGLDALSMRRLGAELGVDPMTAYRHLPNKDALLDGAMEAVITQIDLDVDRSAPWQDQLRQLIRSDLDALLAHPNMLPLLARRPLNTPASLMLLETALQIMTSAGVPLREAVLTTNAVGMLATSIALAASESRANPRAPQQAREPIEALDPASFPRIREALETGQTIESYDQLLTFATDAFIRHLEVLAGTPAAQRTPGHGA
jgi:AcrR family transcriptional regulator